jgi:ribokinase
MRQPSVIVVGSLNHDIMVAAPDRPRKGETVMGERWWPKAGGKGGNQAVEAALAGASVRMIGAVGDDDFGAALLANLARAGVDSSGVRVLPGAASGMSVAIVDAGGDYGAVVVPGANLLVDPDVLRPETFAGAEVLVLQNEVPEPVNLAAARAARAAGARVILNAAPARDLDPALGDLVDVLVCNAVEAEMLGAGPVSSLVAAERAARILHARFRAVVVTAGGSGVAGADGEGAFAKGARSVDVESTHGAGDCFVGVMAARLAAGASLRDAVKAANEAAAALVATPESRRAERLPVRAHTDPARATAAETQGETHGIR